eukprot:359213-Chlamydomonas_euryale.AAC.3
MTGKSAPPSACQTCRCAPSEWAGPSPGKAARTGPEPHALAPAGRRTGDVELFVQAHATHLHVHKQARVHACMHGTWNMKQGPCRRPA